MSRPDTTLRHALRAAGLVALFFAPVIAVLCSWPWLVANGIAPDKIPLLAMLAELICLLIGFAFSLAWTVTRR